MQIPYPSVVFGCHDGLSRCSWLLDPTSVHGFQQLWRCTVIFQYSRMVWIPLTVILVGLIGESRRTCTLVCQLTATCTALGCRAVHDLTGLSMPWSSTANAPGIVYIAVALAYNLFLSGLIIVRIIKVSQGVLQLCVTPESRKLYAAIIGTMCISAAVYTIVIVITLVGVAIDASLTSTLLPLLGQVQVCKMKMYHVYQANEQTFCFRLFRIRCSLQMQPARERRTISGQRKRSLVFTSMRRMH